MPTSTRAWSGCTRSTTPSPTSATRTRGSACPGCARTTRDGSFDVDYDIPLAFYDCRLDDGVTTHQDFHDGMGEYPNARNPRKHPEWWGKTFYKHFPNHGFVGDIFTVNGTANPVLEVKRRKYRFRFLDASVARIYEFKLMSSTQGPKSAASLGLTGNELQGQYRIPDGQQCMKFTQIATDGGLIPFTFERDSFELWPAKRREFIVDFTKYQDGTPTTKGDVIYLTNVMRMPDGRMWTNSSRFFPDPNYKVPVLKFVIGDDADDNSVIPTALRPLPAVPSQLEDAARQPLDLRGQAGQHRRRDGVADQRQAVRPGAGRNEPAEPCGQDTVGPTEGRELQPLGDPQRRRRVGPPPPPAHGGAPHADAQRQGRAPCRRRPSRRRVEGRPRGAWTPARM